MAACDPWNTVRYRGERGGHYESWFLRANHPSAPRAFWIRYTIFSPKDRPQDAVGELWAIAFDREAQRVLATRSERPIAECSFSDSITDVRVGDAKLSARELTGEARQGTSTIAWDLHYDGTDSPLLLLPQARYTTWLPKAKAVTPQPNVRFSGALVVDGERWDIDGWLGSQNHNWGSKHTDFYAWGQVAGFDNAPDVFLECATARLKIGPLWTPPITLAVLRLPDAEIRLNTIGHGLRARGTIDGFNWNLHSQRGDVDLKVRMSAPPEAFAGLTYRNPPGGSKTCLNSKLARCELTLLREGHQPLELTTEHRAAFEILTDNPPAEVPVLL
ncbi:MAG: hypothetical protein JKY37_17000 [Nannocystaceae bacterium]|nr:hypothetical protein [Nannocystaceae bacterium]